MSQDSPELGVFNYFSAKAWLVIVFVSVVLAGASGVLLVSRLGEPQKEAVGHIYDVVERFIRDTIRLSFKTDQRDINAESVYVAPQGILEQTKIFKVVGDFKDFKASQKETLPVALTPDRLLDPEWQTDLKNQ